MTFARRLAGHSTASIARELNSKERIELRIRWTTQVRTIAWGQIEPIVSGSPVRPSQQTIEALSAVIRSVGAQPNARRTRVFTVASHACRGDSEIPKSFATDAIDTSAPRQRRPLST